MDRNFLKQSDFYKYVLIFFLVLIGLVLYAEIYLLSYLGGGDFEGYGYWWIALIKKHLLSEFSFPYFTPSRCGGFLLAADGQVYIFSLYPLVHFFVPHVVWSMKITNLLLSIILATGMYQWLFYLGIKSRAARFFTGFIISISGYWVFHLTNDGTQLHVQSFAYIPWILVHMEKLFIRDFSFDRTTIKTGLWLTLCLFLMGNGGYFWLQYFPYIFLGRLIAELISPYDGRLEAFKKIGFILFCFMSAILLSWPHLGGVIEFEGARFLRNGTGFIPNYGIIWKNKPLFRGIFFSLFGEKHVIKGDGHWAIGGIWEYSNFIGSMALIPVLIGILRIKKVLKSKLFWTMVFASLVQFAFVRTHVTADLLRAAFPFFKSLTHYWRGSASFVLSISIFMALGYEFFFQSRHKALVFVGIFLMIFHLTEIHFVYQHRLKFKIDPINNPSISEIGKEYKSLPDVCEKHGGCELCHLFGYDYWGKIPGPLSFDPKKSVYDSGQEGYYNMHDIKELFSPDKPKNYYMTHKWPLWPKTDQADFEKFIRYKQVYPLPFRLIVMNRISMFYWLVYMLLWLWIIFPVKAAALDKVTIKSPKKSR